MDPNRSWRPRGNNPTHYHAEFGRVPDIDRPQTPPFSRYIPQWEKCGRHNCGNHHYQPLPQPGLVLTEYNAVCRDCARPSRCVSLHHLRCEHYLCRDCLNRMAEQVHQNIQDNKEAIDMLVWSTFALQKAAAQQAAARTAAPFEDKATDMLHEAYELAGLWCCGEPRACTRFLYCMDPEIATQFWLDLEYLSTPQHRHNNCAWPDCGAFVSGKCGFYDPKLWGPVILHCPLCKGNGELIRRARDDGWTAKPGRGQVWNPANPPMRRDYTAVEV